MKPFYTLLFSFCYCLGLIAGNIELGKVNWLRDLGEAQQCAKSSNKPILILFQEVPGCSTCRNYGSQVLSHPLIVEAIEHYFIPVCIYNNKKGKDADVLKYFSEPSWNNPVVHIVDTDLKPLVDRLNANYSSFGLVSKINTSLTVLGIQIPVYLQLLEEELKAHLQGIQQATVGMYCFWTGEKTFGHAKGVVATNAGFMDGSEVVEIYYNPAETNIKELIDLGKRNQCADRLFSSNFDKTELTVPINKTKTFQIDKENKYYIYQSDFKYLPMTAFQATRANSLLGLGKSCESVFSPKQLFRYQKIKKTDKSLLKNQIGKDILTAWYET